MIIDISPQISENIAVFPGDVPFRREVSLDFKKGDHLTLSAIRSTLHLGAHADGPNHYSARGVGIGERSLEFYMGPCLVLEAIAPRGTQIRKEHFKEPWRSAQSRSHSRILLKTLSFPNPDQWNSDFSSISPDLIHEWAQNGVRLVGIDTPSIDPEDSKTLLAHRAVEQYDMAILEGLDLSRVDEGEYFLVALPLRIEGADASPVRAVLLKDLSVFTGSSQVHA